MSKFSGKQKPAQVRSPIATTEQRILTEEGGVGWARDPKSELFLLAITNLVGEDTFYESGATRDQRFSQLVQQVTADDPEWIRAFVPILRNVFQLRSAAVVMAAEYVAAGGPAGRGIVSSALQRPDEPAEMLGYWFQTYGRALPAAVKRGVADAVTRMYSERSLLRYDGTGRAWRFGDVIDLTHPTPKGEWQNALFKYALDTRHGHTGEEVSAVLPTIAADRWLMGLDPQMRRSVMASAQFQQAGWSWERLSGWLPGGMDREAWLAAIPNMGYMALLRNLRNFDEANLTDADVADVMAKLADPIEVARSRQFPFRFLSAFREVGSLRWAYALEQALEASLQNVPSLPGRTLVMVDLSGSMYSPVSSRNSKRERWEVALVFGAALAKRAESADLITYGSSWLPVDYRKPLLRILEKDGQSLGGTYTMQTLTNTYSGHDRVIIVTDEQAHDAGSDFLSRIPLIYTFNLAGYRTAHLPSGTNGRYSFGGLTDSAFQVLPIIEQQRTMDWPKLFEVLQPGA